MSQPGWRVCHERRVVVALGVFTSDSEAEGLPDVVHDALDVGTQLAARHVEPHGLVAAGDVEADSGRGDPGLGRDDAADRDAVAEVAVGHEGETVGGAGALLGLFESVGFVRAEDGDGVDVLHCVVFLSGGIPLWLRDCSEAGPPPSEEDDNLKMGRAGVGLVLSRKSLEEQKKKPGLSPRLVIVHSDGF